MAGVKNHARMDGDSKMLGIYVHLSGADIEKKIYFDTLQSSSVRVCLHRDSCELNGEQGMSSIFIFNSFIISHP